jgi:hypothetical protein
MDTKKLMVENQIIPNNITNKHLLDAFRAVDQDIVPEGHIKYSDCTTISKDGYILKPVILARIIQCALDRKCKNILYITSGSFYGVEICRALGIEVDIYVPRNDFNFIEQGILSTKHFVICDGIIDGIDGVDNNSVHFRPIDEKKNPKPFDLVPSRIICDNKEIGYGYSTWVLSVYPKFVL